MRVRIAILVLLLVSVSRGAEESNSYTVTITAAKPPQAEGFKMGASRRPDGTMLTVDSSSLRLNGKPWTPVMGEFHYSRYPENEWRGELLKMKAGGIDVVATYVFWIHHEEIEGQFDWSGRRGLRGFVEAARDAGLQAVVRCGPWCHGEVRNGGLPDWILQKGWRTRSDDPNYLAKVRILYGEIAGQVKGLLWKDGGPVIGVQFENEYSGPAQHLLTLKRIAREVGLDVPMYTRTGWPNLRGQLPFGEILPLYGVYAEGFWDRELTPMPGDYRGGFRFALQRTDSAIATDQLGRGRRQDAGDVAHYPYLTCEVGGGMMNSYHRRILIEPADIESTVLVKIGSGSNLPGYYMYHGGVNPEGKLTTLMESQATEFWNDMPVKNYDFQAPLGEYGQVRPHYHMLRRLHLFLRDFGAPLSGMPPFLPEKQTPLRWAVRSDGVGGFVFVNNYERLASLPAVEKVQFTVNLPSGPVVFPDKPVTVPAGSRFFWPFNLELAPGVRLAWATAQPICTIDDNDVRTIFFAETPGVPPYFLIEHGGEGSGVPAQPSRRPAWWMSRPTGRVQMIVLNEADSLALWKGTWQGRERVFLTRADLVLDGDRLRLTSANPSDLTVDVYPGAPETQNLASLQEGLFRRLPVSQAKAVAYTPEFEQVRAAGPARVIPMGKIKQAVAAAPLDADFDAAAVWRIKLPAGLDLSLNPILRLRYVGDVARVTLDGKLLTDDFYNGNAFDIGLRRHAPEILKGDLCVAILPLRKEAPIYMAPQARPDFGGADSVAALKTVEIVPCYEVTLNP